MKYLVNDLHQVIRASDGYIIACCLSRENAIKLATRLLKGKRKN